MVLAQLEDVVRSLIYGLKFNSESLFYLAPTPKTTPDYIRMDKMSGKATSLAAKASFDFFIFH